MSLPYQFAIVVSRFNEEITSRLKQGVLDRFKELYITEEQMCIVEVPGAVEIPLIAKLLAKQGKWNAIICLGAVIQGDTQHFDYVCDQVSQGCQQVALETEVPIIFGVLTTPSEELAMDRAGGKAGNKGRDCADAAVEMAQTIQKLI